MLGFVCLFLSRTPKINLVWFAFSYHKHKKLVPTLVATMSVLGPIPVSPMERIFTFKQGSEESFKEAWSRISDLHEKTEPKMTKSLFLSSFYLGIALCYRYAWDAVVVEEISSNAMRMKLKECLQRS